jgi:hypothetical protein
MRKIRGLEMRIAQGVLGDGMMWVAINDQREITTTLVGGFPRLISLWILVFTQISEGSLRQAGTFIINLEQILKYTIQYHTPLRPILCWKVSMVLLAMSL